MKKLLSIAVVLAAVLCLSSCNKDDDKCIEFSPSSVTLSVGQSQTVSFEIKGLEVGLYDVRGEATTNNISLTSTGLGTFTLTGISAGSGVVNAYVVDYPDVKGVLRYTVE